MANLTPEEYFRFQFTNPDYELLRAVRIDSPNSVYKRTVQPIMWLVKKSKKSFYVASLYTNSYESDGVTYKKQDNYQKSYFETNFVISFDISRSEMEALKTDSAKQLEYIMGTLTEKAGISDGPWSVTQDPWNPNVVPPSLRPAAPTASTPAAGPTSSAGATASGSTASSAAPTSNAPSINPLEVSGKFVLKVTSGPGVIIGNTEVDIANGKAVFEGIQFDEPGDYVVSVTSTSPDVDSSEIKITVKPQPEVIPQESKGGTASEPSGSRPIIAQIDQPTIKLPPMSFPRQGATTKDTLGVVTTIGKTPFVNYNGMQINDRDIQSLTIYHEGMIPKIDITFRDSNSMLSAEPPRDDTRFEVFLNPRSNNIKPIHMRFKIEDYKKMENNLYQFYGILDVPHLYRMKFKVYRGTSFAALREVCKGLELGFNSNIENTKDEMPWRCVGDKTFRFMEEIVKHSYISDESFMAGYIDYYYCFNYVDVEKEMKRDISNDIVIDTGGFDDTGKDDEKISKLMLTSEKGMQTSSLYFIKTGEKNESTKTSMEQGYKTRTKFYDKVKKMFLVFDVDSTTSDESKTLILKGQDTDKEAFDNNYVTKYEGKIDTDNSHKNYNYAVTQNRINLDNMVKNQMEIKLPNPNFCLYKYQKVLVSVIKDAATPASPELMQWRWSGEWLISDIRYTFIGGKLDQQVTLVRKEMGKNPEEMKEKPSNKPEAKTEKNENPIVGTASSTITNKPNEAYAVGEEYTVQDASGKKYVVKILSLSENGNDVKAELRDIDYVAKQTATNPDTISGVTQSDAQAATASATASAPEGSYWPTVQLDQFGEEMPQQRVTGITRYHKSWAPAFNSYISKEEHVGNDGRIYIAINRPIPDFKPEKEEKNETPFTWVLFELLDAGIDSFTKVNPDYKKHDIIKSRLLSEYEQGFTQWKKPKGYIRILDSTGKIVIDSEKDSMDGSVGQYLIEGSSQVANSFSDWFSSEGATQKVSDDQAYTNVGGPNTIYIDMSNPTKFAPGTYTLEVKYIVPKFPKNESDRLLEPKDADGNSPYEEKLLKKNFTISKKSKKK